MTPRVSVVNVWVLDQDLAKEFYIDTLGLVEVVDIADPETGYRWMTVAHPDHQDVQLLLMRPGPPLGDDDIAKVTALLRRSALSPVVLDTADCAATFARLEQQGVELVQPPTQRAYGVEAVVRDGCGNWLAMVERPRVG